MHKICKYNCYIEEYTNENNALCARLRDKKSNKIVSITGEHADKRHFLSFLAQAKINQNMMPTIFDRDGIDIVAVRGYTYSENSDEIIVNIDIETGGYLFE